MRVLCRGVEGQRAAVGFLRIAQGFLLLMPGPIGFEIPVGTNRAQFLYGLGAARAPAGHRPFPDGPRPSDGGRCPRSLRSRPAIRVPMLCHRAAMRRSRSDSPRPRRFPYAARRRTERSGRPPGARRRPARRPSGACAPSGRPGFRRAGRPRRAGTGPPATEVRARGRGRQDVRCLGADGVDAPSGPRRPGPPRGGASTGVALRGPAEHGGHHLRGGGVHRTAVSGPGAGRAAALRAARRRPLRSGRGRR